MGQVSQSVLSFEVDAQFNVRCVVASAVEKGHAIITNFSKVEIKVKKGG